jgi:hypothetical protein
LCRPLGFQVDRVPHQIAGLEAKVDVAKIVQVALAQAHAHQDQSAYGQLDDHQRVPASPLARSPHHDFSAKDLREMRR